jgi:hypothetical protein
LKNKSANNFNLLPTFKFITMKKILTAAAILATLTTGVARADTFDFSYTFSNGDQLTPSYASADTVTGSFSGTLDTSSNLISNIADIQVSFDGVAFSGPLIATGWNTTTSFYDDTIAPIVSPIASLNNFAFADVDLAVNQQWNNGLVFVNDPNAGGQTILAYNGNIQDSSGSQLAVADSPLNASWTVVAAVPLPSSLPMMLAGLGLLATAARRRMFA